MNRMLIFALTIFLVSIQPYDGHGQETLAADGTISTLTVRGSAEISAVPDRAVLQLGAVARSEKAADAQNQVNRTVNTILKAVAAAGISQESISTAELTLVPVYDRTKRGTAGEPDHPRIVGYQATNMVRVETRELQKIGDVIDAAIGAGANRLERLSFVLQDDTLFRKKALRAAVLNAREKAAEIADAAKVKLVRIIEITEEGTPTVRPRFQLQRMAAAAVESTPVEPGRIQVSAAVIVGYQIQNSAGKDVK